MDVAEDGNRDTLMTFYGRIAQAWFTTEFDLRTILPAPLKMADPHRAFIKIYQLKMRRAGMSGPPAFSQYRQVCVATLAAPPGMPERHYNFFMWDDRFWAAQSGGNPSWNKKQADIELSWLFPVEECFVPPGTARTFVCDVSTYAHRLVHFDASLDGRKRIQPPSLSAGFYCGGGDGDLYSVPLRETYLGDPLDGTAELIFGDPAPNERSRPIWQASVLGDVIVEGAAVQDVYFSRVFSDLKLALCRPFDAK